MGADRKPGPFFCLAAANESHYQNSAAAATGQDQEMRCGCGSLLARLVSGGVELKCRRCKRTVVLSLEANGAGEVGSPST